MKNNDSIQKFSPLAFLLIALASIVAVAFIYLAYKRNMTARKVVSPSSSSAQENVSYDGTLSLELATENSIFGVGEPIIVTLVGDSHGQKFGGYDAVFSSSDPSLEFVKATSLVDGFEVKTVNVKNLSITGIIDFNNGADGLVADATPLAQIEFKKTTPGSISFNLAFTKGETNDSNIVLISPPSDILGAVKGINAYVVNKTEAENVLTLTQPLRINNGEYILTLEKLYPEPTNEVCNDCMDEADITVKKGDQSQKIHLSLGGIAGKVVDRATALGYIFETTDISQAGVVLRYAPEKTKK